MRKRNHPGSCDPCDIIGHSFGGLIVKQALVNAGADNGDEFCRNIRQQAYGFVFLGTPHRGAQLTVLESSYLFLVFGEDQSLHDSFMYFLRRNDRIANTVSVFEAAKEFWGGIPITHVVTKESAVIDGSEKIGFDTSHRELPRIVFREDERYMLLLDRIRNWTDKAKLAALEVQSEKTREETQEEQACLQSLAFPEMDFRKYDIRDEMPGTCTWLLKDQNYATWLASNNGLLWIEGKPGSGKSTLLKHALQQNTRKRNVVASFFFHDRGTPLQKSPLGLFRSLLHQLLDKIPEMLSEFSLIYKRKCGTEGNNWEWHVTELRKFLERVVSEKYSIRLYMDALDESGESVAKELVEYFQDLISLSVSTDAGLSICFSCRHYPVLAPKNILKICTEQNNQQDVATYVWTKVRNIYLSEDVFFSAREARTLEREIVDKASGVFQWVVLVVPIIQKLGKDGESIGKIYQKINELPVELGDLYGHILCKLTNRSKSPQLMQWICFAQRPLLLTELRYAMVVGGNTSYTSLEECQSSVDFAEADEQMARQVRSLSGGLAETRRWGFRHRAQFIHQSVNDYLIQSGLQWLDGCESYNAIGFAHSQVSRSCIRYLTMKEVQQALLHIIGERKEVEKLARAFPLLDYTRENWYIHARISEAQEMPLENLLHLFKWPLNQVIESSTSSFHMVYPYSREQPAIGTTLLHIASRYGLLSVIEAIVGSNDSFNIDTKDSEGWTALHHATRKGHKAVVRLLIENGADVEARFYSRKGSRGYKNRSGGGTVLHIAAEIGDEALVGLLLEKAANVEAKTDNGDTSLQCAYKKGHEAVVRRLLQHKAEMNAKNLLITTSLHTAAWRGQEAIVRLLLGRGAKVNERDNIGKTALHNAARRGQSFTVTRAYEKVIRLLLKREADINGKDRVGSAPLHNGAEIKLEAENCFGQRMQSKVEQGNHAVVRLLLGNGAEINAVDNSRRTPLHHAALQANEAVVRLLLMNGAEIEAIDQWGRTPLYYAAEAGCEATVQLLLENGADVKAKGADGTTAVDWARSRLRERGRFTETDTIRYSESEGSEREEVTAREVKVRGVKARRV